MSRRKRYLDETFIETYDKDAEGAEDRMLEILEGLSPLEAAYVVSKIYDYQLHAAIAEEV